MKLGQICKDEFKKISKIFPKRAYPYFIMNYDRSRDCPLYFESCPESIAEKAINRLGIEREFSLIEPPSWDYGYLKSEERYLVGDVFIADTLLKTRIHLTKSNSPYNITNLGPIVAEGDIIKTGCWNQAVSKNDIRDSVDSRFEVGGKQLYCFTIMKNTNYLKIRKLKEPIDSIVEKVIPPKTEDRRGYTIIARPKEKDYLYSGDEIFIINLNFFAEGRMVCYSVPWQERETLYLSFQRITGIDGLKKARSVLFLNYGNGTLRSVHLMKEKGIELCIKDIDTNPSPVNVLYPYRPILSYFFNQNTFDKKETICSAIITNEKGDTHKTELLVKDAGYKPVTIF